MEGPVVTVKQGKLRGIITESKIDGTYIAFKGIPYAAPPLRKLRFKDPEPPAGWSGIRDASQDAGDVAVQVDEYSTKAVIGGEDCLYLNVYTTSLTEKKPVIVWIHGGAFSAGTGRRALPDYLIDKGIVLVCINYRLGALGFLNLGHEEASGNQGLKDQVAALKWVQENISNFGGDPNNVLAFGASAGAASVHLLSLSPMAKGLMHKGLLLSGVATCPWSMLDTCVEHSFRLAKQLGNDSDDPIEVVEFLRSMPAEKLIEMQDKVMLGSSAAVRLPFAPSIDDKAKNPFLPRPLNELIDNANRIPLWLSYSSHEFIMFMKDISQPVLQRMDKRINDLLKTVALSKDEDKIQGYTKAIRDHYFGGKSISQDMVSELIQFMSDFNMVNGITDAAINRCKKNVAPTYISRFSYIGNEPTTTRNLVKNPVMVGASHVDDLAYIFYDTRRKMKQPLVPTKGSRDRMMIERMTRLVTNFAKTGNPTSKLDEYVTTAWKPVAKNEPNLMNIDEDMTQVFMNLTPRDIALQYA